MSNEKIKRQLGRILYSFTDKIETIQLIWYGQKHRIGEEKWPKRPLSHTPSNKKQEDRIDELRDKTKSKSKCGMQQRLKIKLDNQITKENRAQGRWCR